MKQILFVGGLLAIALVALLLGLRAVYGSTLVYVVDDAVRAIDCASLPVAAMTADRVLILRPGGCTGSTQGAAPAPAPPSSSLYPLDAPGASLRCRLNLPSVEYSASYRLTVHVSACRSDRVFSATFEATP